MSFAKDSAGALEVTDINNYYPFGLNHVGGVKGLIDGYKNYKYNGKELHSDTGLGTFASARDYGNVAAGYMAGRNGMSWDLARVGLDGLETIQNKGIPTSEGKPTQKAEKVGHNAGIRQYLYGKEAQETVRRMQEDMYNPFNTPKF